MLSLAAQAQLCALLPSSALRLAPEASLSADAALRVTHRVDLTSAQALCGKHTG